MEITIISTVMIMVAYFLLLYAGVGFIQKKKFFSSAPQEILEAIPAEKERFKGAHVIGWMLFIAAIGIFVGALVLGIYDGVANHFTFGELFLRLMIMVYGMELFDIFFFDWVLLSHSNFYPHFYPEVKDIVGPQLFGFNKKAHLMHFIVYIPVCAAVSFLVAKILSVS